MLPISTDKITSCSSKDQSKTLDSITNRPGLTVNFVFPEEILINHIGKDTLEGFQTYLVSRGTIVVVK